MSTVIEMQNGTIASNSWTYCTKEEAEVKMYQTLHARDEVGGRVHA